MQADGAFAKLFGIDDAMNGISGIYGAGMSRIHFDSVGGRELALSVIDVLRDKMEIFDHEAADGDCHPAILVAMIVH
jgi:hypothetical protein